MIQINFGTWKEIKMTDNIKTNKYFTWLHRKDIKVYRVNVKIIPSRMIGIFFHYSRKYLVTISLSENIHKSSEYEPIIYNSFSFGHYSFKNNLWKLQNLIKNGLFRIEMLFKPKKKKEIIEFIKKMEKK